MLRKSPSGPEVESPVPFARLTSSVDMAFLDGVTLERIPFDTVEELPESIGTLNPDGSFTVQPGTYLCQVQVGTDTANLTTLFLAIADTLGGNGGSIVTQTTSQSSVSAHMKLDAASNIRAIFSGTGLSGNLDKTLTSLIILKLS